ncbi:hypothetical protein GA0115240_119647 [Streptomyces sp. DvalAA-14]|uniref:hypothetical protein n=1 Tax=unclassified Streptomyces TaxID=2593676 RepID=UPI00081BABC1|nr:MULTISPECIES: hypothetical protein [unclassified Streptomyces]MYS20452.1 hypothetical protein [Streptomyces sp. SID4948]SCD69092.1 hypothetical protein GA0115240_119647 [Streptomyces sp. DvalAA-14]
MWWLFLYVGLSTAGLLVLGVLAVRVFLAVGELSRQVALGTEALTRAGERLSRAATPMAERAGEISRR